MIVAEDKKIKKCPVSLQPDIENLLQDLSPDDFASASRQEKDDFIQDRQSVSYWKDAWRRLKKNVVAMVALGVIVFLFLFAFVGPLLIPYGYDEFNKGAENLYPYHYTLEDTQRVNDEIASRTQSDVVDVDEMIAQAKAEAEKKGEKFTKKDEAVIRAKAKVAAKPSEDSSEEQSVDEDSIRKELGIKKHIFGYSQAELERKANGEKVFPHVFGTDMYGRDILVRVMYGARVSMSVGVFAAILVLVIGALYGAISGSAPATTAAVGTMTIPILDDLGYDHTFSASTVAVAGGLGVIIPPSVPFIVYSMASGASVGDMFLAGIIPGFLIAACLMIYAIFYCKTKGENKQLIHQRVSELRAKGFWGVLKSSFWALLSPIIILGGIYGGIVTPTEAA